ncbi:hypothetical protein KAR28_00325 [Candidatus Parcubacteria bacterium]|nr:hypothetical protein [Candidatus Parcubacteria bacterium]
MTIQQAAELDHALEKNGWTAANLKKASEGDVFTRFLDVLLGRAEINYLINTNADPYIPDEWSIIKHRKGGQVRWDPEKISLFLSEKQQDGKVVKGDELYKELSCLPVLNANVLDFLLDYSHLNLIPEEWKGKTVCFWGTVYRNRSNGMYGVRAPYFCGGGWTWGWLCFEHDFDSSFPAILFAN